jgi:hypothetical protein
MTDVLVLTILPAGVAAIADLEESVAPETCAMIRERLPIEGRLMHGRYSGPEIFLGRLGFPEVPPENLTHLAALGDVGYFCFPAGRYAASPEGECEIVVIHDNGAQVRGPEGQPMWVNRFARIRLGNADAFFAAAGEIRLTAGSMRIELGRAGDHAEA